MEDFMGIVLSILIIVAFFYLIIKLYGKILNNHYKKKNSKLKEKLFIEKFLKNCNDKLLIDEINEYKNSEINKLESPIFLTKNYIFIKRSRKTIIIKNENIIWVYKSVNRLTTKHGGYLGDFYRLIIILDNKKTYKVNFTNLSLLDRCIMEISNNTPFALFGYNEYLMKLYKKDFKELVNQIKKNNIN